MTLFSQSPCIVQCTDKALARMFFVVLRKWRSSRVQKVSFLNFTPRPSLGRGVVPWTTNCLLCKTPETIEHVFIYCWDALLFWDVLQRTLKKDLEITSQSIRFLPITPHELVPYDLIMLVGLYSIWCSRMAVRNADLNPRSVEAYFVEFVTQIRCTYTDQSDLPQWVKKCEKLSENSKRT
ncbi:unnamed protein product [Ixodes hexagonus]